MSSIRFLMLYLISAATLVILKLILEWAQK